MHFKYIQYLYLQGVKELVTFLLGRSNAETPENTYFFCIHTTGQYIYILKNIRPHVDRH